MNQNPATAEKSFFAGLIALLSTKETTPTIEQVREDALRLAEIHHFSGNIEAIIKEATVIIETRMGEGASLIEDSSDHDEDWVEKRKDITPVYENAYDSYLRSEGWPPRMVQSLSNVTTRILSHLQDPMCDAPSWNRRGLVIGHVQSGKTANYIGLIGKAADAGYKFIIVVAGIHNNLRKQTQERIDESFIGRSSDPQDRRIIGVGNKVYPHPATLTNIYEDFDKSTAEKSGWKLNDFSRPIVIVIKKNVTTLYALHKWLKELNAAGDGRISDVPMLMIDDEADNASINTNREDLDPTRTNAMIRLILRLFAKACYVGYTATPFANIFINPDGYRDDVREELFPRDFIYSLDAPNTYLGAEKMFVDDSTSERFIRMITDCEELLPIAHKRDHLPAALPQSLQYALDVFIIARVIRNIRGQEGKHSSMMINVSRFIPVQKTVYDLVSLRIRRIKEAVLANYGMPEAIAARNVYLQALKFAYEREFLGLSEAFSWTEVKKNLYGAFEHLQILVINSKSDQVLNYARFKKDGIGITVIAIGGLSLSRGLTIEGLSVSYMYRNTRMYDTLMQMGRWFGYRPGYEDLCRVFLSPDSISWYGHIAAASEDLCQQIRQMRLDRLSPKQFGLYVMAHPDSLLITARSKMRSTEEIILNQNYSGQTKETSEVSLDREINARNFSTIQDFWRDGFGGVIPEATKKGLIFREVECRQIEEFILKFSTDKAFSNDKDYILDYLAKITETFPRGDVLLISPGGIRTGTFNINPQARAVTRLHGDCWRLNKDRVASKGDEGLGLSDEQIDDARRAKENSSPGVALSDCDYRKIRKKPLLLIHNLKPIVPPDLNQEAITTRVSEIQWPIAAFGLSFPPNCYATEIRIVANRVWLSENLGSEESLDEEDDYDER